jgi:hypothetical protein
VGALGVGGLGWSGRSLWSRPEPIVPAPPLPVLPASPVHAALGAPLPPRPGFHRGMCLAHLHRSDLGYGSAAERVQLQRLVDLGVSHVSLTPFAYARSLDSTELQFGGDRSLTDDQLRASARQARALGLQVCLKPHLWSDSFWGGGKGNGDLNPADWGAWFESYRRFAVHYAALAEEMGAALYVVGLEYLSATEANPGAWADIAQACRAVYGGQLSYAANWWREAEVFADWAAFDAVGVNAWHPISEAQDPGEDQLVAGWEQVMGGLLAVAGKAGKPLLLTEVGLRAVRGAAARPWDQAVEGAADPDLQARAYRAILRVAEAQPAVQGVYFWKWFTSDSGRERDAYAPMGLVAEDVLRSWWGGATG